MKLFQRKPQFPNQDEAASDLSVMLHSDTQTQTFRNELLDPCEFDYSLDSLKTLDDFLDTIRKDEEVEKEWNRTVLRAGAYAGEVIRRSNPAMTWHWIDHETASKIDPDTWKNFEKSIMTVLVLYRGGKSFCFPLGKVHKFLENGREDSLEFFAKVMIENWKKEDA